MVSILEGIPASYTTVLKQGSTSWITNSSESTNATLACVARIAISLGASVSALFADSSVKVAGATPVLITWVLMIKGALVARSITSYEMAPHAGKELLASLNSTTRGT